ncbi:glycosyltransferase [Undibacterium sp. Ji49W]|uniref:glycosyltransferase n=1 Tax=Undibacterium sp. Ji49W TaxID=3413040 RepID=UPI003BF302EB
MIIAPYWCDPQHLGQYRIERFVRWLSASGVVVTIIASAEQETFSKMEWGHLICIPDPLGIYGKKSDQRFSSNVQPKHAFVVKVRRRLRLLAYALLSPDPGVLWARRAMRHPLVKEYAGKADAILSSSFPESVHVAASHLAFRFQLPLLVDMRDGWLDEPMKPLLVSSALQRWREGLTEKRILKQASLITVTSERWKKMLVERLPFCREKTVAITNAYPPGSQLPHVIKKDQGRHLQLMYAGRIFSSRAERKIADLLHPLLEGLPKAHGNLIFVGDLSTAEIAGLRSWEERFRAINWTIEIRSLVPRQAVLELLTNADGLIMLSSSQASIPAKLFDYLVSGHPILAIASMDSIVGEISARLPQLFVAEYENIENATKRIEQFINACQECITYPLPDEFSDESTRQQFMAAFFDAVEKS